MKSKKRIILISLISIILISLIGCFKVSYGAVSTKNALIEGVVSIGSSFTLVGVFSELMQVIVLGISVALNGIMAAVTGIEAFASGNGSMVTGVKEILFNKCSITTANFFNYINLNTDNKGNPLDVSQFAGVIGQFYMIIRNLSVAILLFVLLYIGIRMAISTVAEDQAKYKKMLSNWAVSLALVFVLHFIIIITFVINDTLVNALFEISKDMGSNGALNNMGLWLVGGLAPITGWPEVIVYTMLTVAMVAFFITYIKRVISLGFLIVISPLITITYSIDKIGDGKSQALNTWLKEFIFTVLIQPFHCIIYIVFVNTSIGLLDNIGDGLINGVLAAASMLFMLKAEGIVKKIFGLQADSMGDTLKSGALALSMATGLFKNAGKNAVGKVPVMKNDGEQSGNAVKTNNNNISTNNANNSNATNNSSNNNNLPTNGGNGPIVNNTGNAGGNTSSDNQNQAETSGIRKALAKVNNSAVGQTIKGISILGAGSYFQRASGETGAKGTIKGATKFALTHGAAAFAGIAGTGLGDGGSGISSAVAAQAAAESLYARAGSVKHERQAEANQQVFANSYYDFKDEWKSQIDEDISDEELAKEIERLLESDGQGVQDKWKLKMLDKAKQLKETGEALGYKDGAMYVSDTLRKIRNGDITPEQLKQNDSNN